MTLYSIYNLIKYNFILPHSVYMSKLYSIHKISYHTTATTYLNTSIFILIIKSVTKNIIFKKFSILKIQKFQKLICIDLIFFSMKENLMNAILLLLIFTLLNFYCYFHTSHSFINKIKSSLYITVLSSLSL